MNKIYNIVTIVKATSGTSMMYWLCITTEENWKVARKLKVWGVAQKDRKKLWDKLEINDFLVFYVKQRKELGQTIGPTINGISKVTSDPIWSEEKIFRGLVPQEKFPWRVKIEHVKIPKEPIDFRKLVPKLKFIKKKRKWFVYLQRAMRTIPKEDFDMILSTVRKL